MDITVSYKIGSKVKHLLTDKVCEILKVNTKTFKVKRLKDGYTTIYEEALIKKVDCEPYIEPPKVKSLYERYRERVAKEAGKLPKLPTDTSQHILWLKAAITEKVETIDKLEDPTIYTFRKEDSENKKFGFSEHYVNLLMQMAYDAGHKNATDDLTERFQDSSVNMKNALDKIKDALDDANWIDYPDGY